VFTPNRDGITDRDTINVYVNKDADLRVYLLGKDNISIPSPKKLACANRAKRACHIRL